VAPAPIQLASLLDATERIWRTTMAGGFDDENGKFRVLVNEEEQYSLWLDGMEIPRGWTDTGVAGDKKTCLDYVGKVWTDMRPKSLRVWMEEHAKKTAAPAAEVSPEA
jgi:MbtH protein